MCVYCGVSSPNTRDHVPPKVLLDEPYPQQLPVVDACEECNRGFSLDEQYLACFIECVLCGTVEPSGLQRPKIKRIISENSSLSHRIGESKKTDGANKVDWQPEFDRIQNIVVKLGRGHVAYEFYPKLEDPIEVRFAPLMQFTEQERRDFENITSGGLWPEIGGRAFYRACGEKPDHLVQIDNWIVVQPGLYRFAVSETNNIMVKMVLSEYLACTVLWNK